MDRRDVPGWIAIELTRLGEAKVEDGSLDGALRRDLRVDADFNLVIPAATFSRRGKSTTLHLVEGYVFVGAGLDDTCYFALERQAYTAQVMSSPSGPHRMRTLATVTNAHIDNLKVQLRAMVVSDLELDTTVKVTDGRYRHLEGRVVGLDDDHAFVRITLRSLDIIATIPRIFLEECAA